LQFAELRRESLEHGVPLLGPVALQYSGNPALQPAL